MPKIDLNQLNKNFSKIFFKNLAYIKNSLYLCTEQIKNLFALFDILKTKKKVYLNRFIFPYLIKIKNLYIIEFNKIKNTKSILFKILEL